MSAHSSITVCTICGKDCSGVVNLQTHSGRYYCRTCFVRALNKKIHVSHTSVKSNAVESSSILKDIAESIIPESVENPCPACDAAMPEDALLCCECGHNLMTGESNKGLEKQVLQKIWDSHEVLIEERLPTYKKNLFSFFTGKKYRRIELESIEPIVDDFGRFYQKATYYCRKCWNDKEVRRRLPDRRFHKVLCVLTLGLWLPIWLVTEIVFRFRSWRCTNCRGRIRKALID